MHVYHLSSLLRTIFCTSDKAHARNAANIKNPHPHQDEKGNAQGQTQVEIKKEKEKLTEQKDPEKKPNKGSWSKMLISWYLRYDLMILKIVILILFF